MDKIPSDYELIYYIRQHDDESMEQLIAKYRLIIWKIVHKVCKFKPIGFDKEDLFQEGMMALVDATRSYRDDKDASFSAFACVCIERQIRSYMRKTRTESYKLLSGAKSLDASLMVGEDDLFLKDVVSVDIKEFNPAHMSMVQWAQDQLPHIKEGLPEWQWHVYHMHQLGYSYKEISLHLNIKEKEVDNTLQKIKHKLTLLFDTNLAK